MIVAALAASSAREMVLVTPTPLGFTTWDTFKQGWYKPEPVSCFSLCFLGLLSVKVQVMLKLSLPLLN